MKTSTLTFIAAAGAVLAMSAGCSLPDMQQAKAANDLAEAYKQAQNGNIQESHNWCDKAIAIDPKNVKVYVGKDSHIDDNDEILNIALIYSDIADDPSLITYMQQATQKFPNQALPWLNMAEAYGRMGKPADQIAAGKKAVAAIEPDITRPGGGGSSERMNELAQAYYLAGNMPKSATTLQSVMTTYPADTVAYNMLAWYYAETNDTAHMQQALTLVNTAISNVEASNKIDSSSKDATLAAYQDTLGWIQYRMHQYPAAIATLQKAVAMSPRRAEEHYHLGKAYLDLDAATAANLGIDNKAAARSEFQLAVSANPTYAAPADELKKMGPAPAIAQQDDSTDLL